MQFRSLLTSSIVKKEDDKQNNGVSSTKKNPHAASSAAYSAAFQSEEEADAKEHADGRTTVKIAAVASESDSASLLTKKNVFSEKAQQATQANAIRKLFDDVEPKVNVFKLSHREHEEILNDVYKNELKEAKKIIGKKYHFEQYATQYLSVKNAFTNARTIYFVLRTQLSNGDMGKFDERCGDLETILLIFEKSVYESVKKLRAAIDVPNQLNLQVVKLRTILSMLENTFKDILPKENAAQPAVTVTAAAKK